MQLRAFYPFLVVLLICGLLQKSRAQQVTNFSESTTGTNFSATDRWWAKPFTTGNANYSLTNISILASSGVPNTTSILANLLTDSSGTPGTVIQSMTLSNAWSSNVGIFTPTGSVTLSPNTIYWFEVKRDSGAQELTWLCTPSGGYSGDVGWSIGDNKYSFDGSSWVSYSSYKGFMSVNATAAVPEPSTYAALIGLAALGLAGYRRRHW